jgi:hypothetical protein
MLWPKTRRLYNGNMADWGEPPINRIYTIQFIVAFIVFLCHALAALGFGSIFTVLRWKAVVSPPRKRGDLCCFARKAFVRCHESTEINLVLRGSFACQHHCLFVFSFSCGLVSMSSGRRYPVGILNDTHMRTLTRTCLGPKSTSTV